MLDVEMNGKALLSKTISVREKEIDTDFRQVPEGIRPQEACELLRREWPLASCPEADCSKAPRVDPNEHVDRPVSSKLGSRSHCSARAAEELPHSGAQEPRL